MVRGAYCREPGGGCLMSRKRFLTRVVHGASPLAPWLDRSYGNCITVNPVTGFGDPTSNRRTGAHHPIAGAFFVPAMPCYGGRAWETFGSAGSLLPRFANLRTAASLNRLATVGGSSDSAIGAPSMLTLHPFVVCAATYRALAFSALRSDSPLSVRLARYRSAINRTRFLEAKGGEA